MSNYVVISTILMSTLSSKYYLKLSMLSHKYKLRKCRCLLKYHPQNNYTSMKFKVIYLVLIMMKIIL